MFSALFSERHCLGVGTNLLSGSPQSPKQNYARITRASSDLIFYEFLCVQSISVHCSSSAGLFTSITVFSDIKPSYMNSTFGTNRFCLYKVA